MKEKKSNKLEAKATTESRLVAQKISKDGSEAVRNVDSRRSASADRATGGPIIYATQGELPQPSKVESGEEIQVGRILIERLNQERSHWGEPKKPDGREQGIDCVAYDRLNKKRTLMASHLSST